MEGNYIHIAAIIVAILFSCIAVFQVLLSLGYPLGEAAMGGYHKILPKTLRFVSAINAISISKSKKERYIMTPLSSIAFILCIFVALS
jgi:hypothetical protein